MVCTYTVGVSITLTGIREVDAAASRLCVARSALRREIDHASQTEMQRWLMDTLAIHHVVVRPPVLPVAPCSVSGKGWLDDMHFSCLYSCECHLFRPFSLGVIFCC